MKKQVVIIHGGDTFGTYEEYLNFLLKYSIDIERYKFDKESKAVFLVSAMFDYDDDCYSLQSFSFPEKLDLQTDKIYLYHSKDDKVVPFRSMDNLKSKLPNAV